MTKRVLIVDDEPLLIAVLREIFARFQHGHTYEITPAHTVADDTEKEAEALIEGAAGYLHKPFDLRELNRLVTLALGGDPAPSA